MSHLWFNPFPVVTGIFWFIHKAVMFAIIYLCSSVLPTMTNSFQVWYYKLVSNYFFNLYICFLLNKNFLCSSTGWSHFAQFTIAVVNRDPKKSKYSGWLVENSFSRCKMSAFLIYEWQNVKSCRYFTSILEERAWLGLEKVYGALKSFWWV